MKPILFNTDMVRAILAGKKTQTRRIVKGYQKENLEIDTDGHTVIGIYNQYDGYVHPILDYAPYIPGDILYVRETFGYGYYAAFGQETFYKADYPNGKPDFVVKWHPSIHMPKEAARIFLRVTNVRVERLQNIQSMDAIAEGAEAEWHQNDCGDVIFTKTPIDTFAEIWDKTIKPGDLDKYGWYANPWVWAIEFERIKKEKME